MTPDDRAQLPLRAELREWCVGRPHEDAPVSKGELLSLLDALDAAEAERDRLAAALRGYTETLEAVMDARDLLESGRCLADITHRDEGHRQSVCMRPKDHAPLVHDDCLGCTWSDANHWEPSAVDALAAAVERVRALHNRQPSRLTGDYCAADGDDYPCPTRRALDGGGE